MGSVTENPGWWKGARGKLLKMALEPRTDCIIMHRLRRERP